MKKIKLFIFPLIFAVFSIILSGILVIKSEKNRQIKKQTELADSYNQAYISWKKYKEEYSDQVEQMKRDNIAEMEDSRKQYEDLLSQQPGLIAQHIRVVEDSTYVPQSNSSTTGSSSNGQTTKKIVKVSKPKSAPATSAS